MHFYIINIISHSPWWQCLLLCHNSNACVIKVCTFVCDRNTFLFAYCKTNKCDLIIIEPGQGQSRPPSESYLPPEVAGKVGRNPLRNFQQKKNKADFCIINNYYKYYEINRTHLCAFKVLSVFFINIAISDNNATVLQKCHCGAKYLFIIALII